MRKTYKKFVNDGVRHDNMIFDEWLKAIASSWNLVKEPGESNADFKLRVFRAMESTNSSRYVDLENGVVLDKPKANLDAV